MWPVNLLRQRQLSIFPFLVHQIIAEWSDRALLRKSQIYFIFRHSLRRWNEIFVFIICVLVKSEVFSSRSLAGLSKIDWIYCIFIFVPSAALALENVIIVVVISVSQVWQISESLAWRWNHCWWLGVETFWFVMAIAPLWWVELVILGRRDCCSLSLLQIVLAQAIHRRFHITLSPSWACWVLAHFRHYFMHLFDTFAVHLFKAGRDLFALFSSL